MPTISKEEARPACKQCARHAKRGVVSLPPAAKEFIYAALMALTCLCLMWGVSAIYQAGYVGGYEDAKAVYHG